MHANLTTNDAECGNLEMWQQGARQFAIVTSQLAQTNETPFQFLLKIRTSTHTKKKQKQYCGHLNYDSKVLPD